MNLKKIDHTLVLLTFFLYLHFQYSFVREAVAVYFLPQLYMEDSIYTSRLLTSFFSLFLFFYTFVRSIHIPKSSIKLFLLGCLLCVVSLNLGTLFLNNPRDISSHFQYYMTFFLLAFSLSRFNDLESDKIMRFIGKISPLILLLNLALIFSVYSYASPNARLSLSLYSLSIPTSFYLSRSGFSLPTFISLGGAFLSLKRSIWLSNVVQLLFSNRISKRKERRDKILVLTFAVVVLLVAVLFALIFEFSSIHKFATFLETRIYVDDDRPINWVDRIGSGRLTDFYGALSELIERNALHYGLGFGASYDSYGGEQSGYAGEWIKNGSDVMFLHFWLIHGVWLGSAIFLLIICFAFNAYQVAKRNNELYYTFLFYLFIFNLVNGLLSFVPYDPIWGIVCGLMTAREKQLYCSAISNA